MIFLDNNKEMFSVGAAIKYKKLNNLAIEPTHGSEQSAGWDLCAAINKEINIPPHQTVMIGTGLAIALPSETFGAIFPRSGISSKRDLAPANKVGVIDADYRGEIKIALHNHGNNWQTVQPGERIAQLVVLPYYPINFQEVQELDETERGEGGFNSTGTLTPLVEETPQN